MIKFFRNIRKKLMNEGKTSRYLAYALGEIILVVIGILIALQINNWNETRKEKRIAHLLLENLQQDLGQDLEDVHRVIKLLQTRMENASDVLEHIQKGKEPENKTTFIMALVRLGWILNNSPTFATYNEIVNSGKLSLIHSAELKAALADYKSQTGDNQTIEHSYDAGLKLTERKAIGFLSPVPEISTFLAKSPNYEGIEIDFERMQADALFLENLKHIIHFTGVDIAYKENLIIPKIEKLQTLITNEIAAYQ